MSASVDEVSNSLSPEIAIVVPTYNERAKVVDWVHRVGRALEGVRWEVIFVDDDSPDGTAELVCEIARRDPRVRCLKRLGRRGFASACMEGLLSTSAPFLAVMGGDLQEGEKLLGEMVAVLKQGQVDLVVGSRYEEAGGLDLGWGPGKLWLSRLAAKTSRFLMSTTVGDPMSGYFALTREAFLARAPQLTGLGTTILLDLLLSKPTELRVRELPVPLCTSKTGGRITTGSPLLPLGLMLLFKLLLPDFLKTGRSGQRSLSRVGKTQGLTWILAGSLFLVLGLRFYAAYATVPIRTWDDSIHRRVALEVSTRTSLPEAAKAVFLPNPGTVFGRSNGYHSWLVFFRKVFPPSVKDEYVWQSCNLFLLFATCLAFTLAWRQWGLEWCLVLAGLNLWLLSPIVFGINRWVMTENHLVFSLALCTLAFALVTPSMKGASTFSPLQGFGLWKGLLAGLLLCLASTMREYAIPLYLAFLLLTWGALLLHRKWLGWIAFTLVLLPYLHALEKAMGVLRSFALEKAQQSVYYNPFGKYLWHTAINGLGPGVLLICLGVLVVGSWSVVSRLKEELRGRRSFRFESLLSFAPLAVFFLGLGVYAAGGLTLNTTARNAIPGTCALVAALFPLYARLGRSRPEVRSLLFPSLVLSWAFLSWDLFFAFHGGSAFAHHPTHIEYYNHPLHLRPLENSEDMHVVK